MKAITVQRDQPGNPMAWTEVPDPDFSPDEVLVDIQATSLNRADLLQRAGNYPVPSGASPYMGLEMAGTVAAVGSNVSDWQKGDRVYALLNGGGYAEKVSVPGSMLLPIPDEWEFAYAGAIPEVFLTAYLNLFMEAGLQSGDTVLMHGGASGVGTAGIQMAHHAGCRVLVTAGTEEKTARCRELGADLAVNYKEKDFVAEIQDFTDGAGVDVIMDMVGAAYLERNLSLLKVYGRIVVIALLGGATTQINLGQVMRPRLRLIGSVLRPRSIAEKVGIIRNFEEQFGAHLRNGRIQPIIDSVYPIEQANEAQARMAANLNIGKIVMRTR